MIGRNLSTLQITNLSDGVPVIPQNYAQPGLSLAQVLSVVWAYRLWTLLIAFTVVLLTGLTLKLLPKTYEATATVMVNYEVNDPLGGKEFPIGLLGGYMATQVDLMQSPEVLLPVVDKMHLTTNKDYTAGYDGDGSTLRQWAAQKVRKHLDIKQGQSGSELIYVTYSAHSADEAAAIANAVSQVYAQQHYDRVNGPANDHAKRYSKQLQELKQKVDAAQDKVTAFRQRTGLTSLDSKVDIEAQKLGTLEQRLLEVKDTRREAEAKLSGQTRNGDSVLNSNLIQGLKTQLAAQQAKLAQMSTTLGPRYPEVQELRSQIESTRETLNGEIHAYSQGAHADLAASKKMERELQDAVETQRKKVINVRQLQDEGDKYVLGLQSAQEVYKRMLDGYDQIMFTSQGHYTNVSVASKATPPLKASKPKVLKGTFLGGIMGIMLGLFLPLTYELLFNRRVRCRDDLERDHGVPVLAEFGSIQLARSVR